MRLAIGCALVLVACSRDQAPRVSSPRITSAPASRTIDSTGWVDNGGRTSDQHGRTEHSGMRATEAGSERPTGTPGSGLPLPIEARPKPPIGEGAGQAGGQKVSGAPTDTAIARIGRAECDRATFCEEVGPKRKWATDAACLDGVRDAVRRDVANMECPGGVDNAQLATCLTTLRQASCSTALPRLEAFPECTRSALCTQR